MKLVRAIANLGLRVATVALIAGATFLILLGMHLFGAPLNAHPTFLALLRLHLLGDLLDTHPVTQALAVACIVAWRLYRGSTPVEEIRRFLNVKGPCASAGLRSNNRVWTPPSSDRVWTPPSSDR